MFLTESNLLTVVKKQYYYKLKTYSGLFLNMIAIQLIAIMFSFGGTGSTSSSSDTIFMNVKHYSADLVIIFTIAWAFIAAIIITGKAYRNVDFTLVSNRISSNLSNIYFLLTGGIIGGVTAILAGSILRVIIYFSTSTSNIIGQNFIVSPRELFIGMIVATLYMILFSAIGYFFGTLAQLSKALIILLPTLILGILMYEARLQGQSSILVKVISFFTKESSFGLFAIKVFITAVICFISAVLISNRMEARR